MTVSTDPQRAERLREENEDLAPLMSMFSTTGWSKLSERLTLKQSETRNKLILPAGVSSIEEVYAQRERLGLINWLLDLPEDITHTVERNREELFELEQREGQ